MNNLYLLYRYELKKCFKEKFYALTVMVLRDCHWFFYTPVD